MGSKVSAGAEWLGMRRSPDGGWWELPVLPTVTSGANALFGGSATAAALVAASELCEVPVFWAGVHFGRPAPGGSTVRIQARVLAAGRTLTHLTVEATAGETDAFSARLSAGRRPSTTVEGHWISAPEVAGPEESEPFDLPVHADTWAARFDWRLARLRREAESPMACWWVSPQEATESPVILAELADYVTYGVGRALGSPMGGLSVDNNLRIHHRELSDWLLLAVRPDAVSGGIGVGSAFVYDQEGRLLASGTQTMVVNDWDWRRPEERQEETPAG
jgi:acyl-CoA thioesterase